MEMKAVDLTKIEEQLEVQNENLSKLFDVVSQVNDTYKKEIEDKKQKEINQAKLDEERQSSGELTTEEQILKSLESIASLTKNKDEKLNALLSDVVTELKASNQYLTDNGTNLKQIATIQQDNSKMSKEQNNLFLTYGIIIVPVLLFLFFLYKFLRQFI